MRHYHLKPLLRPIQHRRTYSSAGNLIQIRAGTFYREHPSSAPSRTTSNPPLFPDLTFSLPATPLSDVGTPTRKTAHWAVIGASNTSAFLDVLRGGLLCIPPTARSFPYLSSDEIGKTGNSRLRIPSHAIQYVGFSTGNKGGAGGVGGTQGAYLSARYESRREETDWSVSQHLRGETELNPSEQLTRTVKNNELLDRVIRDLRLGKLLDMPVSSLSNGQTRRCRIAKALLGAPKCLLLDEPFMGLDPPSLVGLSPILRRLAERSDPLLVLGLRPQDPVPEWITDLVVLGRNHRVGMMGKREEVMSVLGRWGEDWQRGQLDGKELNELSAEHGDLARKFGRPFEGFGDVLTEKGIVPYGTATQTAGSQATQTQGSLSSSLSTLQQTKTYGQPVIELDSIRLSYGTKMILGHPTPSNPTGGLTLTIKQNSRIALLGPNGSGKTTLLSLLTSDHPQSYSLPIKFFGRTRLPEPGKPGLSRWEIQSRIGHSAPEVHSFYPKAHSVRRVLESAWADTYASKPALNEERERLVDRVLAYWEDELRQDGGHTQGDAREGRDLTWARDRETHYFGTLPFGAQRLLLLLRAIIKSPDIVILDEAFSGIDSTTRDKVMDFLERGEREEVLGDSMPGDRFAGLKDHQALVVVSHVREEVPPCVDEWVRLPSEEEAAENGRDVKIGLVKELEGGKGLRGQMGWNQVWGL